MGGGWEGRQRNENKTSGNDKCNEKIKQDNVKSELGAAAGG